MVNEMKWALALLCCLHLAGAAELTENRTVYLLPITHSLDQFIANRLVTMHVLQVVTDPAKADTVVTDQVGAALEERLKDLYPPPTPPAKEAAKSNPEPPKAAGDTPPSSASKPIFGDASNKVDKAGNMGAFGRGHGTIFLVDVKTRQVLWSVFDPPKNNNPRELDRTAERIVKRLKEDLSGK